MGIKLIIEIIIIILINNKRKKDFYILKLYIFFNMKIKIFIIKFKNIVLKQNDYIWIIFYIIRKKIWDI